MSVFFYSSHVHLGINNLEIINFFKDFLMWIICKVFTEFITILLLYYVLVFWLQGMWDLSSLPGIEHASLALEGEVLTTGWPGKSLEIINF